MRRTGEDIFRQPLESSFSSISLKSGHRRREIPSDDRNLGGGEGGYEGADFEERILLFWENYRRTIIGAVAVVFSVVLVYQLTVYLDERRESALRGAYQLAEDREERLAFAREHAGHPLAGFAYLEVANEEFSSKEYGEAANHYKEAIEPLGQSPLASRAELGYAVAAYRNGEVETAEQALRKLSNEDSRLDGMRAEAAYDLAVLYWERGNFAEVKSQLALIEELEKPGYWSTKANRLRSTIPELRLTENRAAQAE